MDNSFQNIANVTHSGNEITVTLTTKKGDEYRAFWQNGEWRIRGYRHMSNGQIKGKAIDISGKLGKQIIAAASAANMEDWIRSTSGFPVHSKPNEASELQRRERK
jgi:hypothetical protein